jgi:hypothetical protein
VEPLTIRALTVAERTCAGCNSPIAPTDSRWIGEGQHISNESLLFHDNRCLERMLNREYAEYLHKKKLDFRQEFHRAKAEKHAAR